MLGESLECILQISVQGRNVNTFYEALEHTVKDVSLCFNLLYSFRHLFWTDSGNKETIERSDLSGENRKQILHVFRIGVKISYDHSTNRLHFFGGSDLFLQSVDANGNNRQYHAVLDNIFKTGLAIVSGKEVYYYSNAIEGTVSMARYTDYDPPETVYVSKSGGTGDVLAPLELTKNGNNIYIWCITFTIVIL